MPDSLAILRQFVSNARPLLDSLTALHFARRRIAILEDRLAGMTQERNNLASMATTAKEDGVTWLQLLAQANAESAKWRRRYRSANAERWLLRFGLAGTVGLSVEF